METMPAMYKNAMKILFFLSTTLDICLELVSMQLIETKFIFFEKLVVNGCQQ